MSHKIRLHDLHPGRGSLTEQLVARFTQAIDDGVLAPGERLPTTRELARTAGVNPVTAARVYRRLAERGYVTATVGRGTFVRRLPPFAADALDDGWQAVALPAGAASARERPLQEALRLAGGGEVISLAAGFPSEASMPVAELAAAAAAVFADLGPGALSYTDVEGVPELRELLAELGRRRGFAEEPDEILVTTGARQAIDLVVRTVVRPGDVVCVESPTFPGTLASIEGAGAELLGVPVDEDGLDVAVLEQILARHAVKLVALQSAAQNPTGRHLSPERRARLVELARERSFFVLEDGAYADTVFTGTPPLALRSEAPSHVLHAGSFSKTLGGGLRVGWVAARGPLFGRLVAAKLAADLNTSPFDQRVLARFLREGSYDRVVARLPAFYRRRAELLRAALDRQLEGELDVLEPLGGHHLWVTFRRRLDERTLTAEALRHGVAVIPGSALLVDAQPRTTLRVTFSGPADEEALGEGAKRLARAFRATLRAGRHATAPVA
jgi:DNA-binding transcriptional MocR family regulator